MCEVEEYMLQVEDITLVAHLRAFRRWNGWHTAQITLRTLRKYLKKNQNNRHGKKPIYIKRRVIYNKLNTGRSESIKSASIDQAVELIVLSQFFEVGAAPCRCRSVPMDRRLCTDC